MCRDRIYTFTWHYPERRGFYAECAQNRHGGFRAAVISTDSEVGHPPRYSEQRLLSWLPPWHNLNSPQLLPHIKPQRRRAADVYRTATIASLTPHPREVRQKMTMAVSEPPKKKREVSFSESWPFSEVHFIFTGLIKQTAEQEGTYQVRALSNPGTILVLTMQPSLHP